jgi:hypothetical protein
MAITTMATCGDKELITTGCGPRLTGRAMPMSAMIPNRTARSGVMNGMQKMSADQRGDGQAAGGRHSGRLWRERNDTARTSRRDGRRHGVELRHVSIQNDGV